MSNPTTFTLSSSTQAGSPTVAVPGVASLTTGLRVYGLGVPIGTTLIGVNVTAGTATLSANATLTQNNVSLYYTTAFSLVTAQGPVLATQPVLYGFLSSAFLAIYPGANLDSDTPDGQALNIFIQVVLDVLDFLLQLYNGVFNLSGAIGISLDVIGALIGVQRQAGTFTVTPETITTTQACQLQGLDLYPSAPYTISDSNGNQWQLQTTYAAAGPGTQILSFQAANPGAVLTVPDTITTPVTIVPGVSGVNNPTAYTTLGIVAETDASYRLRMQQSQSIGAISLTAAMKAALLNVPGVSSAWVNENDTAATVNGIPPNSIWVVVAGSPAASAIANVIYVKRGTGCGMRGGTSYVVTQPDGSPFTVYWDAVTPQPLYIKFNASWLDGINAPNLYSLDQNGNPTGIIPLLANQLNLGINQSVNPNQLGTAVQAIDPNTFIYQTSAAMFCATYNGSYVKTLAPSQLNNQFAIQTFNTSCATTMSSETVTVPAGTLASLAVGMSVYSLAGGGITPGTTIASINIGAGTLQLSANCTVSSATNQLLFSTVNATVVD